MTVAIVARLVCGVLGHHWETETTGGRHLRWCLRCWKHERATQALTEGTQVNVANRRQTRLSDLERRAWELHRANGHPKGYDGPCWGPTEAEKQQAKEELRGAR